MLKRLPLVEMPAVEAFKLENVPRSIWTVSANRAWTTDPPERSIVTEPSDNVALPTSLGVAASS